MNIGIIGSGIGAIATSIRLARAGHRVTVMEKNPAPGGKIFQTDLQHYRFDGGPSTIVFPEFIEELYQLCGENIRDYLQFIKLDNGGRYFFNDGSFWDFPSQPDSLQNSHQSLFSAHLERLFQRSARVEHQFKALAACPGESGVLPTANLSVAKWLRKIFGVIEPARSMHMQNRADFSDPALVDILDLCAVRAGSDPFRAPALLNLICGTVSASGHYIPSGGMYSLVRELYELALRHGVEFRFRCPVGRIVVEEGKARGIIAGGAFHKFDIVVCGTDVRYAATRLIGNHPLGQSLRKSEPSCSALLFYWGMDRKFDELDVRNVFLSGDCRKEFRDIFNRRVIPADPTIELFISSRLIESDAPDGCDNWTVKINVPANTGQNWAGMVSATRKKITDKLSGKLGTDISRHIMTRSYADPLVIESNTNTLGGALCGTASNSYSAISKRHPHYLTKMRSLYFVGASVSPAGSIPCCLEGARNVANLIGDGINI